MFSLRVKLIFMLIILVSSINCAEITNNENSETVENISPELEENPGVKTTIDSALTVDDSTATVRGDEVKSDGTFVPIKLQNDETEEEIEEKNERKLDKIEELVELSKQVSEDKQDTKEGSKNSTAEKHHIGGGTLWQKALHTLPYDKLYKRGIDRYLNSQWEECVADLQLAIDDHRWHRAGLLRCRRNCSSTALQAELLAPALDPTQVFFERTLRNALCLIRCRRDTFKSRSNHVADIAIEKDFAVRKPYDYLQLCLFKVGRYREAANAAVTVLAAQPSHEVMAANLRQYTADHGVEAAGLASLELQEYAKQYIAGDAAHQAERHSDTLVHMQAALAAYWSSLQDCRVMCDEPFDQGWFPDFVSSIANHFTYTFRCKRACPSKLANFYGEEVPNFLATMFNYLQFAYHKMGSSAEACAAVGSFLALRPEDADMLRNRDFYKKEGAEGCVFDASQEVRNHVATEEYETKLLAFIDTEFLFLVDDKPEWQETKETPPVSTLDTLKNTLSTLVSEVFAGKSNQAEL